MIEDSMRIRIRCSPSESPRILPRLLMLFLFFVHVSIAMCEPPGDSLKFFRDLAETRDYTLGRPVAATPTPDGSAILFLRSGARDPVQRLYEMDVRTGQTREVMTPEAVLRGAEERLSVDEKAR